MRIPMKLMALAVLLATLAACGKEATSVPERSVDQLIVGGGIAGLTTANRAASMLARTSIRFRASFR